MANDFDIEEDGFVHIVYTNEGSEKFGAQTISFNDIVGAANHEGAYELRMVPDSKGVQVMRMIPWHQIPELTIHTNSTAVQDKLEEEQKMAQAVHMAEHHANGETPTCPQCKGEKVRLLEVAGMPLPALMICFDCDYVAPVGI